MKTIALRVLLAATLCLPVMLPVIRAEARPLEQTKAAIAAPILIEHGRSSRMHVVYRHDKHLHISCLTCHHKMSPEQDVFVSCNSGSTCHPNTDISDRASKSYYQALHRLDSQRSCRGCHVAEKAKYPSLDGCQTCHSALPEDRMDDGASVR